eukprot:2803023-Amphidinium_carterae.1
MERLDSSRGTVTVWAWRTGRAARAYCSRARLKRSSLAPGKKNRHVTEASNAVPGQTGAAPDARRFRRCLCGHTFMFGPTWFPGGKVGGGTFT